MALPSSRLLFSCSVMSTSLKPYGQEHARLPCPSPSPRVCSNSCPLSRWCHPTVSSSVTPFSSCPQSFPASGSFPMSQLFTSGGQSIGTPASASVLPMNIQDWFPLRLTRVRGSCKPFSRFLLFQFARIAPKTLGNLYLHLLVFYKGYCKGYRWTGRWRGV